jgi:DNA (cytosine-5)-methyltransferase 1
MNSQKLIREKQNESMRVVDLFAGTGAFSYVFKSLGHEVVFANDIEPASEEIYKLNFPEHNFVLGDLNNIPTKDIPEHDILCGGFPCQPFSIAGKQEGFEDKRSNVIWKMFKIIKRHKPKILLLENVKNLLTHDNEKTFKTILKCLEKLSYNVKYKLMDTCKYTEVPQHRERVYIIGIRDSVNKMNLDLNFPDIKNKKIKEFLERNIDKKYYYTKKLKAYDKISDGVKKSIDNNVLYQYRRYYVRENKNGVCPTLTANMGSGGHNVPLLLDAKGIRKLTPRECFNLQGFPTIYKLPMLSDSRLYKLAGNAVSVPIILLLVKQLIKRTIKD